MPDKKAGAFASAWEFLSGLPIIRKVNSTADGLALLPLVGLLAGLVNPGNFWLWAAASWGASFLLTFNGVAGSIQAKNHAQAKSESEEN